MRQNYNNFMKIQQKAEIKHIESSTFNRFKRYFKNLWLALLGRNPYQMERVEARGHLEKAAEDLKAALDVCEKTLDQWGESQKQLMQMQQLVETLRGHLREKDDQLEQLHREYNDCIEKLKRDYEKRRNEG